MTGKLCAALRPKGALYLHGMMSGFVFTAGVPDILFRGVVIQGFWLETWLHSLAPQRMHEVCVRHASNVAGGSGLTRFHRSGVWGGRFIHGGWVADAPHRHRF